MTALDTILPKAYGFQKEAPEEPFSHSILPALYIVGILTETPKKILSVPTDYYSIHPEPALK